MLSDVADDSINRSWQFCVWGKAPLLEVPTGNSYLVLFFSVNSYYTALVVVLHSYYHYGNGGGTCSTKW